MSIDKQHATVRDSEALMSKWEKDPIQATGGDIVKLHDALYPVHRQAFADRIGELINGDPNLAKVLLKEAKTNAKVQRIISMSAVNDAYQEVA